MKSQLKPHQVGRDSSPVQIEDHIANTEAVKSTVSAAVKTQLLSPPPKKQPLLLSFSSTEETFRRFSQQNGQVWKDS
ncbi:hypothetical protein QL285_077717 [Trifolium repens]|nr:hypothetical protein QL285_077717 [Trifolium repens]